MTLLLLACACAGAAAQEAKPLTFPATTATSIAIEIGAGEVEIVGTDTTVVEIRARGAVAAAEGDRLVVRSADAAGPPDRQSPARVDLRVPAGVTIASIHIIDGRLTLRGLRGQVAADVRQGTIRAEDVGGVLRLETGFGDVVVEGAHATAGGLLRLRAFNGDARLTLASQPRNARVLALTFNGTIASDLPLTRRESFGPKFAEATFGNGDPVISIDSVTGNISISVAASPRR
ncbi:MAG TPA: DUF4097 family beta strand repeat-containing protein [Vicinamibacterales bacterium]|nr:DUF4097 family beta strand repeat-containing protein [Vicinamibacterales bacterium]